MNWLPILAIVLALIPLCPALVHLGKSGRRSGVRRSALAASKRSEVVVRNFFACWNKRDMEGAIACFDDSCEYEDTLFPKVFQGKEELRGHLLSVAASLPTSFSFVLDDVSCDDSRGAVGVRWHVESDDKPLPFARGCSMYTVTPGNKIVKGFDVPEPVAKTGALSLALLRSASGLIEDPRRAVPLAAWVLYCYFLFFSEATPGLNALALDPATWDEVKSLSLNFWLVLPTFFPSSAAQLHPGLESVFNLVLIWATLFGGFVIDARVQRQKNGPNMGRYLLAMQALTNAIFLPYLVARQRVDDIPPALAGGVSEELTTIERVAESKAFPALLGALGIYCIYWAAFGREALYGDLATRTSSLWQLVSTDRLSFSLVVDLVLFAAFQGWLIEDDLKLRVPAPRGELISAVGHRVPFFGLVYYLLARPPLSGRGLSA